MAVIDTGDPYVDFVDNIVKVLTDNIALLPGLAAINPAESHSLFDQPVVEVIWLGDNPTMKSRCEDRLRIKAQIRYWQADPAEFLNRRALAQRMGALQSILSKNNQVNGFCINSEFGDIDFIEREISNMLVAEARIEFFGIRDIIVVRVEP